MEKTQGLKGRHFMGAISVILVAAFLLPWIGNRVSTKVDMNGRAVKAICHETISGRFNWHGDVEATDGVEGRCSTDLRHLSRRYVTSGKSIYWMTSSSYEDQPCITGTGDPTGVFYNLSWACLTAAPKQVNEVEDRHLYLVASYSPTFRSFDSGDSQKAYWQSDQLTDYAADQDSVYYQNTRIEGADPRKFSVIFPFGGEDKWEKYAVSRSGDTTFVGGKSIGNVDLREFHLLKPVHCPGHGISSCTDEDDPDSFFQYGNWGGIPGTIGSDIVFLQTSGISRFPDMASPDMFMFATTKGIFFYIRGKFYSLVNDAPYPTDDPAYTGKKLVGLNVDKFDPMPGISHGAGQTGG